MHDLSEGTKIISLLVKTRLIINKGIFIKIDLKVLDLD